ncbi:MAG: guanylate kinase [Oligosphaeraceae bacterium]|nr:guanylate kinase [Oligosphaeraceae bacterium]
MNTTFPVLALVLSGPSGVGKSSVCQVLFNLMPNLHFSVSCTTRAPRPSEIPGRSYHFLSSSDFTAHKKAGDFLEHAQVHGQCYGTLASEVRPYLEKQQDVILDIDVQGARQVWKNVRGTDLERRFISVFLLPPSLEVLEQRLRGRCSESEEQIRQRLARGREEMNYWREYDYVLINNDRHESARQLQAIFEAARCRCDIQSEDFYV